MFRLSRYTMVFVLCLITNVMAETKSDTAMEQRAKTLFLELRCVVCQNQSISDSDADVAKDLREIVREQMAAGQTDIQIKQFLVDRYGEFILLKPVWGLHTILLWLSPLVFLAFGAFMIFRAGSGRAMPKDQIALSAEEEQELSKLLEK